MNTSVLSLRGVNLHPSRCYDYEFEDVLARVLGAELIEVGEATRPKGVLPRFVDPVMRKLGFERRTVREFTPAATAGARDLLFVNCMVLDDLRALDGMPSWRRDSRLAVCWIKELFAAGPHDPRALALLNQFDLVIVNFEHAVEFLRQTLTRPSVMHMPLGIDAVQFCPFPAAAEPSVDVYWMGRCQPDLHHELQRLAETDGLFYMCNSAFADRVTSPREHRMLRSRLIKNTRFFVVQPAKFNDPAATGGASEIGFRYFEGAAAGAVLIGKAPRAPSFARLFPYDDAVIEMPDSPGELRGFFADLRRQPERCARIRHQGVIHCLRNHDWAYRIQGILDQLGLTAPSPVLQNRIDQLEALAAVAQPAPAGVVYAHHG